MALPHNVGSALRIFFEILHNGGKLAILGPKIAHLQPWIHLKDFFEILHNKMHQGVENYFNGVSKKNILGKLAILGPKTV